MQVSSTSGQTTVEGDEGRGYISEKFQDGAELYIFGCIGANDEDRIRGILDALEALPALNYDGCHRNFHSYVNTISVYDNILWQAKEKQVKTPVRVTRIKKGEFGSLFQSEYVVRYGG